MSTTPLDTCLHNLIEAQVERTPEAIALVFEDQALSYRELNGRANRLAHRLRALGVGPESLVGICVERSVEMVVALLGVLKAGGAYVPLDPAYPAERLAFMVADSDAPVLLTQRRDAGRLSGSGRQVIYLDEANGELPAEFGENPEGGGAARKPGLCDLHLGLDWKAQGCADRALRDCQLPSLDEANTGDDRRRFVDGGHDTVVRYRSLGVIPAPDRGRAAGGRRPRRGDGRCPFDRAADSGQHHLLPGDPGHLASAPGGRLERYSVIDDALRR